jgi:hypothetical protein
MILEILPYSSNPSKSIYVGVLILFGNSKKAAFLDIIDRVKSKVDGWHAKSLSQAGRLVLIKFLAATIPSYAMSVFLLLKSICSQLDRVFKKIGGIFLPQKQEISLSSLGTLFAPPKFLVAWALGE